jgi:hypothetical protein
MARPTRLAQPLHAVSLLLALAAVPTVASARRGASDPSPAPGAEAGVCPKVLDAHAPPGGVLQLTVSLTEPTPILHVLGNISFEGVGSVMGVALFSASGAQSDVAGTAVLSGGGLTLQATSPTSEFGTDPTQPILTVAIDVPPDTPLGTTGPLAIDPASSLWLDPTGQPYTENVKNGTFVIAEGPSIRNVSPGGGLLPAGSAVVVEGVGFQPGAVVELDGVPVASTTFVSDREIDTTISADADLYGRGVSVRNPDGSRARYYAYLRTAWLARSARPLLAATDPIFAPRAVTAATYANAAGPAQFLALAIQNPASSDANVTVELRSAASDVLASAAVPLPARTKVARDVSELFGAAAPPPDGTVVVTSDVPVQVLGMVGDDAAGTVAPFTPAATTP